ncbi:hypothetical protein VP01_10g8 [Puccinia sorghi]|uniref:Uncharacterized protein n=1 Tax=Puccinia sorghi TaxID=27349 RepID=A0A0L6VSY4_9BASI|nr:hypothetical protein VP01_10g8 [Puccinia sorghi]
MTFQNESYPNIRARQPGKRQITHIHHTVFGAAGRRRARCSTVSPAPFGNSPDSDTRAGASDPLRPARGSAPRAAPSKNMHKTMAVQSDARPQQKQPSDQEQGDVAGLEIGSLSNKILDALSPTNTKDVAGLCAAKLGMSGEEWRGLKGAGVIIYEPDGGRERAEGISSQRKRAGVSARTGKRSLNQLHTHWPPTLETDALILCILKAGGHILLRIRGPSTAWSHLQLQYLNLNCLRSLFVHRTILPHFLAHAKPSLHDSKKLHHRLQFLTFGSESEPDSCPSTASPNPEVEVILRAGAIIIPTFESLFRQGKRGESMFEELKRLCRHHPFVKVCLHVGLQAEIWARLAAKEEDDDERELEFLLRFLADKFDDINSHGERQKEHSLEQLARWVQLDRNIMAWLPSPPLPAQPRNEISTIASTFKLLRPLLSPHFRHFVIVVPDHCPRKLSRASLEDVELLTVTQLSQFLPTGVI